MTITQRDPKKLTVHPGVRDLPRCEPGGEDWAGFVNDVASHGIKHPLQITADDVVVDGETRRQAAIAAGLESVPCEVIEADHIFDVMVRELIQRRNLTQSAKAFWGYPLVADAHHEARKRAKENLKKGREHPANTECWTEKIWDFCKFLGISPTLFRQAARVHEIFDLDPAYRAQVLPEINEHGVSLAGVIAGYGGQKATVGRPRGETRFLGLIKRGCASWSRFGNYWEKLDEYERRDAVKVVRETLASVPEELRQAMWRELKRLEKRKVSHEPDKSKRA